MQRKISVHSDFVKSVCIIDENRLASGGSDSQICISDYRAGQLIQNYKAKVKFLNLALIQDSIVAGCSEGSIRKYSIPTLNEEIISTSHHTTVYKLYFADDSLFSASADKTVHRFNLDTKKKEDEYKHDDWVKCAAVISDYLITGSRNGLISVFSIGTNKLIHKFEGHFDEVSDLAIEKKTLFSCSLDGTIRKWNLEGKKIIILKKLEIRK